MYLKRTLRLLSLAGAFASANMVRATTYYVSPTGSDTASGTAPGSAWQSLSKVDSTNFAPGSQILFQSGGSWYGNQLITQSGTPSQPITYGSYGNGANPTIWGSVPVSYSALSPVTGSTYFYPSSVPVNSFLINHQFTHNADLLTDTSTLSATAAYIENNPNTSCFVPAGPSNSAGVLVNTGIPPQYNTAVNSFSASIQQDAILNLYANNTVIENFNVRETAAENGGYGIRVQNSSNVQVLNCTITGAGKHAVGVIDSTGFIGQNLSVSNLLPDQQYGGATAYVSYADQNVANTTSQWINCSFSNPGGSYQGFITHSAGNAADPLPIASVVLRNSNFNTSPAVTIDSATSGETVNITGGQFTGDIQLTGNNTVINGATLTGAEAAITVVGTNNTIENTIINGDVPNWTSNHPGAIVLNGANNIVRFNSIELGAGTGLYEAAIALENTNSNDQVYGNIINSQYAAFFMANGTISPGIIAHDNLFAGYATPEVIFPFNSPAPVSSWPTTVSTNELYGDAGFTDPADGDFSLSPGSLGAYVFNPATGEYVMYDFYGNARPAVLASLGAVQVPASGTTATGWNIDSNGTWGSTGNWSNNSVPNSTDIIALLRRGDFRSAHGHHCLAADGWCFVFRLPDRLHRQRGGSPHVQQQQRRFSH